MRAKMRMSADQEHRAILEYDDEWDDRRVREEFYAPRDGGYVRWATSDGRDPQVCDRLQRRGPTLVWYPRMGPLVHLIRREWKRAQRADASFWARHGAGR